MDSDGYPTEVELQTIRDWPPGDAQGLLDYVIERWHWSDWGVTVKCDLYALSTGGWSGNEMLIDSLELNLAFWANHFFGYRAGGHHLFCLDKKTHYHIRVYLKGKRIL